MRKLAFLINQEQKIAFLLMELGVHCVHMCLVHALLSLYISKLDMDIVHEARLGFKHKILVNACFCLCANLKGIVQIALGFQLSSTMHLSIGL